MAESRTLRIGVDGRELTGRTTGVGRYVREVLTAWTRGPAPIAHSLVVFVAEPPNPELVAALGTGVEWTVTGTGSRAVVWEQWHLPRAVARSSIDVFFAGAYTAPLLVRCPFVLVVHDVSYFAHPEWFAPRERRRRQWLTTRSVRRAAEVFAVSQFSAREIQHYIGATAKPIRLAPGGAPQVQARGADTSAADPLVLYVGSLFNRRLIPEMVAGFGEAARVVPEARLVLVGDNRTYPHVDPRHLATDAGITDTVEWRDYVDQGELDRLFGQARVFVFLSTYEGFGLTPLEAIARGVPPVLLDTPVGREIYGEAALFVDRDPVVIGAAIRTLLLDEDARSELIGRGRALLTRYDWARTAATILEAIEQAAGARR